MTSSRHGFTLVEMAIVISIAAIFFVVLFNSAFLMNRASATGLIADIKDVRIAVQSFAERYRYLPGDFPVDQSHPEIPSVSTSCRRGGANAGNGNGLIDPSESACAAEHLIRSGLLRGDPTAPIATRMGTLSLTKATSVDSFTPPPQVMNVMTLTNVPCDIALDIDRKIDDGKLEEGAVQSPNANCPAGSKNIVPLLVVAL